MTYLLVPLKEKARRETSAQVPESTEGPWEVPAIVRRQGRLRPQVPQNTFDPSLLGLEVRQKHDHSARWETFNLNRHFLFFNFPKCQARSN